MTEIEQSQLQSYLLDFSGHEPDTAHDWRYHSPVAGYEAPCFWRCMRCKWDIRASQAMREDLFWPGCWSNKDYHDPC